MDVSESDRGEHNQIVESEYANIEEFYAKYRPRSAFLSKANLSYLNMEMVRGKSGTYFGQREDRKKTGVGVYIGQEGYVYEGEWKQDLRHGKGCQYHSDGSVYQGNFSRDVPEGIGKHIMKGGDYYDGEWKTGKKTGYGLWKDLKGNSYVGEWANGEPDGFGVMTDSKGNKYEGMVKMGKKNGKGIEKFANGDIYDGYFQDGLFHGYGELFWANKCTYKGEFTKGLRQGPGVWKNERENLKYEGFFRQNKKEGYGVFTWSSGGIYKGNFQDDLRNGYGEMFWPNGDVYRGRWKNGKQNGKGLLIMRNKGQYTGIFRNNELVVMINQQEALDEEPEGESDTENQLLSDVQVELKDFNPLSVAKKTPNETGLVSSKDESYFDTPIKTKIVFPPIGLKMSDVNTKMKPPRNRMNTISACRTDRALHSCLGVHHSFQKANQSRPKWKPNGGPIIHRRYDMKRASHAT